MHTSRLLILVAALLSASVVEAASPTRTPTPFITGGLNPSFYHTAGSAVLDGAGVATLTDGLSRQAGAITHTIPLSTAGTWTVKFRFTFGVANGGVRKNG